jgi:hypothetical protein
MDSCQPIKRLKDKKKKTDEALVIPCSGFGENLMVAESIDQEVFAFVET